MARESGATPRALRLYESKGLLSPRRQGAARLYGRADRGRLALVLKAKALGFTLVEIRQMLGVEPGEFGALSITRRQCFDQIRLLEQRKREIETALANCAAPIRRSMPALRAARSPAPHRCFIWLLTPPTFVSAIRRRGNRSHAELQGACR